MQKTKDIIIAGVDMGGTSLRALVVNEKDKILAEEKVPTNPSQKPSGLISDIAALVEKAVHAAGLKRSDLSAVSIGAPGTIDRRGATTG